MYNQSILVIIKFDINVIFLFSTNKICNTGELGCNNLWLLFCHVFIINVLIFCRSIFLRQGIPFHALIFQMELNFINRWEEQKGKHWVNRLAEVGRVVIEVKIHQLSLKKQMLFKHCKLPEGKPCLKVIKLLSRIFLQISTYEIFARKMYAYLFTLFTYAFSYAVSPPIACPVLLHDILLKSMISSCICIYVRMAKSRPRRTNQNARIYLEAISAFSCRL